MTTTPKDPEWVTYHGTKWLVIGRPSPSTVTIRQLRMAIAYERTVTTVAVTKDGR